MASELAERCFQRYFQEPNTSLRAIIDDELRETRTVIEALLDVVVAEGAESYSQATCQHARALMERLEIK